MRGSQTHGEARRLSCGLRAATRPRGPPQPQLSHSAPSPIPVSPWHATLLPWPHAMISTVGPPCAISPSRSCPRGPHMHAPIHVARQCASRCCPRAPLTQMPMRVAMLSTCPAHTNANARRDAVHVSRSHKCQCASRCCPRAPLIQVALRPARVAEMQSHVPFGRCAVECPAGGWQRPEV